MKKLWILICTLMLMALSCLCAAEESVATRWHYVDFFVCQGQTMTPEWPNYAAQIGEGLTNEDFFITYEDYDTSVFQIHADGSVTTAANAKVSRWEKYDVVVKYTPKVEGVGETTVFRGATFAVCEPIVKIPVADMIGIHLDDSYFFEFLLDVPNALKVIEYDESALRVEYSCSGGWSDHWKFEIFPKKVGVTTMRFVALNGVTAEMKVSVEPVPTQVTFAQDVFKCYYRDKIDLGVDYGYGANAKACPEFIRVDTKNYVYDGFYMYVGEIYFRRTAPSVFEACRDGYHTVTYTTHNGLSGSVKVHVYSTKNATRMYLDKDVLREGYKDIEINLYSTNGEVFAPLTLTKGNDIASIYEDKLTLTGVGTIEITATNPDGSTLVQSFEVEPYPTEMILNAENVTLDPMETFQLEVTFDKGWLPYKITEEHSSKEIYGIAPSRREELLITAQNPGTTVYTITTEDGKFTKTLAVTVAESDKAVYIDGLDETLIMGEGYQLYVRDKTGKIYPAAFSLDDTAIKSCVTITAGGYLEGLNVCGKFGVIAELEDGRTLRVPCSGIAKFPKWLHHEALVIRKSQRVGVEATSDVGRIDGYELTYKVANGNILSIEDSGLIIPKRTGTTTVTITSKRTGVSTTFTVEIISDTSTVYIGTTTMYVADGSKMYMPTVYDEKGREATVKWVITHNNPGDGNPDKSGFTVEDDVISCHWPTASCEVTGTVKGSNEKVKVTVYGYRLPETILLEPEQIWLKVGERKQLTVSTPEDGAKIVYTFWLSEPAGVVTMEETVYGTTNTITGSSEGVTLVAAMLENEAIAVSLVTVYDPDKRLPGDANGDGVVDIYDSLLVMQYAAGWSVAINGHQGDVNADGKTDLSDAVLILQYASGMNVLLRQYIPPQ